MDLESKIDALYALPPAEFTAARNALGKTLTGDASKAVKSLTKPTLVPWTVNQLYWKSRSVYERLMKSGEALRASQIAALKGQSTGIDRASQAHKKALADGVHEATRLAQAQSLKPGADELSRMLEALSLASAQPERPGRFTELKQPAGFEALAGVSVSVPKGLHALKKSAPVGPSFSSGATPTPVGATPTPVGPSFSSGEIARELASRRKEAEDNLKAAEQALERARTAEAKARDGFDRAQEDRRAAEAALFAARKIVRDL